jgi:LysR family transcriptional regulator, glycine cleavage system transcriptional activator
MKLRPQPTSADALGVLSNVLAREIRWEPIDDLRAYGRQSRAHPRKQIEALKTSISTFGFLVPLICDEEGRVLAGMARLAAAKALGMSQVPTYRVSHLTPERARAFILAENKLAELGGWDRDVLATELGELKGLELDFSLDVTGFDSIEFEALTLAADDDGPPPKERPQHTVIVVGNLWRLRDHHLLCADATEPESFTRIMGGQRAKAAFLDSPYNVRIVGHVTSEKSHREFAMASGEMSDPQFTAFLSATHKNVADNLNDGALIYSCMDWRHAGNMTDVQRALGLQFVNLCIWTKPQGGQPRAKRTLISLAKPCRGNFSPDSAAARRHIYAAGQGNLWMAHRRLAHLNALRAFEAVARHMSFGKAARELSVTPGALSQQVRLLEDYYGVKLFRRHNRRISLTDEAAAVMTDLETGFDRLSAAVLKLQSHGGGGLITVTAPPTLALKWLVHRLGDFAHAHPNIEVNLDSTDRIVELRREGVDLAIRYGRADYPGLRTETLAEETLTPACAPSYLQTHDLRQPSDLLHAALIHDRTLADHASFPTWVTWLAQAGVEGEPSQGALHFSSSVTAIQAALDGHGVVLGRSLTIEEDVAAGRLATPFPHIRSRGWAYHLAYPPEALATRKVAAFRDWLVDQFGSPDDEGDAD